MRDRVRYWAVVGIAVVGLAFGRISLADESQKVLEDRVKSLQRDNEKLRHRLDYLQRAIDDVSWYDRVGSVAFIDKVRLTGPPPRNIKNPTGLDAGNPVKFWAYVFIPKDIDVEKKYPLMVFSHGGVHSNFGTVYTHIVKELIGQQYIVVAPEYRGSTGYGQSFYEKIDYGALEIEDVKAGRDFMVENYEMVDASRVGIMGWSHGGLISLMSVFEHPEDYKVAFAGVPVSDLISRMGYYNDAYRDLYSADYHIGKTAMEDVNEYRRRSPAWNAHKLQTPLLVTSNTNDEDVNVLEVEHLIKSLKAEGKKFESEIYQDLPGGHHFDRLDTKKAKSIRLKTYQFMARYLDPPKQFESVKDIDRAAYR